MGTKRLSSVSETGPALNFAGLVERVIPLVAELLTTLASTDPLRMSFADIASKTLLDIVETLRADGVSQEAIAAALDLTITGFRAKHRRLLELYREAPTRPGGTRTPTLLERVYGYVDEQARGSEPVTHARIAARFRGIKADTLGGVLRFLIQYGLLSVSGRGSARSYRVVLRRRVKGDTLLDAAVVLYREGPLSVVDLARHLSSTEAAAAQRVATLDAAGRLDRIVGADDVIRYRCRDYHIPLGAPDGFEPALWDHLRLVVRAITKKVRLARLRAMPDDRIGGTTFSFSLPVGHPLHTEVVEFLSRTRLEMESWRERTLAIDPTTVVGAQWQSVSIYTGQMVDDLAEPPRTFAADDSATSER